MKNSYNLQQKGFSLIEVMMAVLVLGVGILAISKLQGTLIKSGADAHERSTAASLVQRKADDLRRFIHITTTSATVPDTWSDTLTSPLSVAYNHIASNEGGLIASGSTTVGNIVYDLAWTIDNYYYSGTDTKATTTPTAANRPDFKMAHITVTWDSASSTNNVVSFDTIIEAYKPSSTALDTTPATGGTGPVIPYDPQQQPDVVPITINADGTKKETTKPLPDLSKKGDSTLVKFETVTYSPSLDTVKREEYRTLACFCKSGANNNEQIYGYTTWDDTFEKIVDVTTTRTQTINKTVVDNSGGELQASECFTCCRDGDDVTSSGSTTFKVCRMKRVDGVLRLFDPWKMLAFNVIPASYFNDSDGLTGMTATQQALNISKYSAYVTSLVRGTLETYNSPASYNNLSTVDSSFSTTANDFVNVIASTTLDHKYFSSIGNSEARQMQARAIYLDYPPSGIFNEISPGVNYSATNVPLDRIPFYEVNMTELAGWIPDVNVGNSGATTGDTSFDTDYTDNHDDVNNSCVDDNVTGRNFVTNHAIENGCEDQISRGDFTPLVSTTTTSVNSRIFTNSDGVVDRNINTGNSAVTDGITLEIQ
jgi:prepilin-type N-terminal cleavage/methylation domain-containing protein